jgi:hypothetical protein
MRKTTADAKRGLTVDIESALKLKGPPPQLETAKPVAAVDLSLLFRARSVWVAQRHGSPLRVKHWGGHRHIRANQTYHQDQHPDRTLHGFSYVRVPWERKPSRWQALYREYCSCLAFLERLTLHRLDKFETVLSPQTSVDGSSCKQEMLKAILKGKL